MPGPRCLFTPTTNLFLTTTNPYTWRSFLMIIMAVCLSCPVVGHSQNQQEQKDSLWLQSARKFYSLELNPATGTDSLFKAVPGNFLGNADQQIKRLRDVTLQKAQSEGKADIFQFQGGYLQYTLNYRSNIDTPFAEQNIVQHLVNVNANVLIAGSLPFTITYSGRQTNSGLFRDFNEVQVNFNAAAFQQLGYQRMTSYIKDRLGQLDNPAQWDELVLRQFNLDQYKNLLSSAALDNFLIDSRKNLLLLSKEGYSSPYKDSIRWYSEKIIRGYDSLQGRWAGYKAQVDSLYQQLLTAKKQANTIRKILSNPVRSREGLALLRDKIRDAGIDDRRVTKLARAIYSIRTLSFGRTLPDYSALSVKNINVKGVNLEYNDDWLYLAFTGGVIDFRSRDFVFRNTKGPLQYVYAGRIGVGQRDGTHWILTGFKGKKQLYFSPESQSSDLFGISSSFQVAKKNYRVSVEVAQSSSPANGTTVKSRLNLADKHSRAWHISADAILPRLQARAEGSYQRTGQRFQSFNTYRVNANSQTWNFKWEQYLWRRQLKLSASFRQNDFSNPLVVQNYKTNTVFKTLQLTFRKKKWPTITAGYIPSSQYAIVDQQVFESRYHTLSVYASHVYKLGIANGSTMFTMSRFYNDVADTGFYYYRAKYISGYQQFLFHRMTLSAGGTVTSSPEYKHYSMQGGVAFQALKSLRVELGTRINNLNNVVVKTGLYGSLRVSLQKLGDLQCWYEDNYLPGRGNLLTRNEQMNISFTRYFK